MYLSGRSLKLLSLGFLVFAFFEIFSSLYFMSGLGLALCAGIAVKFFQDLGKRLEIRDLIAFMSVTQWILGPVLAYNVLPYDELYYMAVTEAEYMNFMVPLCYFMTHGLYLPLRDERIINEEDVDRVKSYIREHPWLGYILTVIGLTAGFISKSLPASLTFMMFLITNIQYVGMYMILFSDSRFRWLIFAGIMGLATFAAVLQGMFGELVQWFMLSFLVIALVVRIPMWGKIALISIGMFLILLVQSTKEEYRMATWYAASEKSNSAIYKEIIRSRISSPSSLFESGVTQNMGARLNQGWIIARIMNHMPEKVGFVHGETIESALYASLLPRFLAPGKVKAGGRANFERFTGTPLPETTSMDISLAGEGYANFGIVGGWAFIFLVSLLYNWVIVVVISHSKKYPTLILWIPILFFQVMKAETDFATVFNYLTKAAIITFLAFYLTNVIMEMTRKKPKISMNPPATSNENI
ncbi:MAG: hypothetical protein PHP04_04720 [Bacteroidales bacterium]|nr:hypothetical protein [Bacteroidales bacterium]